MRQQKPILHARDHLPGGADPLPLAPGGGTQPVEPPGGTIPQGGGTPPPADEPYYWWRFKDMEFVGAPDHAETPDVVSNDPIHKMVLTPYNAFFTHNEVFPGGGGPTGDSVSMLRLWYTELQPPFATHPNPDNIFRGAVGNHGSIQFGAGKRWSLFGWFNFVALHSWDVFNITQEASFPGGPTWLILNPSGSVTLHRDGSEFTSAGGLVSAGAWCYIGIAADGHRIRVYVNPGPPEPVDYQPTYGTAFPLQVPMAMETWGLENGDYSADQLAAKLVGAGVKGVSVQLNAEPRPGRTHADYITSLTADVAALQAAGLEVTGWGAVDSSTGADLTATGVTGWMPQVEGPSQYSALISALGSGVGAGLAKAVVWTEGGINSSAQVTALNAAGITGYAAETYAAAGGPFTHADGPIWQGTQYGMTPAQSIPILGTFRGETPDDYTGLDENIIPNYGIYNAPQTSDAAWAAFAELNKGTVMLSAPVIDVADPMSAANSGVLSIGSPSGDPNRSDDGAFEGYVTEVVLYPHAIPSSSARNLYLSGKYGGSTTVPPQEQIPPAGLAPGQVAPGADGQVLTTSGGATVWDDQNLDDLADVDTAAAADTNVLAYNAATSTWEPAAAGTGGGGGEKWFTGSGTPSGTLSGSNVGDWYLDSATGDYYEKTGSTTWTLRGNLQGPAGAAGAAGAPGEKWFTGSGAPAGSLAGSVVGDWYLDSVTGDYYEKTGASTWTLRGNLQGPPGAGGGAGAADVQTFAASGTWTKPSGVQAVRVICIGGGGGGGGAPGNGGAAVRSGGAGGAGGAFWEETFRAADLTGTVAVTIGNGGSGGAGTTTSTGTNGGNGGDSSFGAYSQACGGGGGSLGSNSAVLGGGGGSYLNNGTPTTSGAPAATTQTGLGNQSGFRVSGAGGATELGGAAGGSGALGTASGPGGTSSRGGCGGGGGAGVTATPAVGTAGAGGLAGGYTIAGGGGGTPGTSGASPAGGGTGGTVTGRFCGSGGGGGGATVTAATQGANGGAGGIGSGGGGGGVSSTAKGGDGGNGGNGRVIVISW